MEQKSKIDNPLAFTSLYISKSTTTPEGVMRWSAVNSDVDWDIYQERMTIELYQKMLGYIKSETPPPEIYRSRVCSDYWCGGMPYLSISHYPDLNGDAVPGEPLELFIDGKQLKARGILFDNKLGNAVWKSLKEDEKKSLDADRIRISIAFLDLAHKHGENGKVYQRLSATEPCEACVDGMGNKIYLDGYLVHLALTRVPVNPRTLMEIKSMTKKTRKEDAESIVPDAVDEIEKIDAKAALENKADVLVEMADTDEVVEEVVVEEAKHSKETIKKEHTIEMHEDDPSTLEDESAPVDKKKVAKKSLTEDDLSAIAETVKAMLAPKTDTVSTPVEKSVLEVAMEKVAQSVNEAVVMDADVDAKLGSINPVLQELGTAITELVRNSVSVAKADVATPEVSGKLILEQLSKLNDTMQGIVGDVALLKSKVATEPTARIPAPRSFAPETVKALVAQEVNKPESLRSLVNRSVGLPPE